MFTVAYQKGVSLLSSLAEYLGLGAKKSETALQESTDWIKKFDLSGQADDGSTVVSHCSFKATVETYVFDDVYDDGKQEIAYDFEKYILGELGGQEVSQQPPWLPAFTSTIDTCDLYHPFQIECSNYDSFKPVIDLVEHCTNVNTEIATGIAINVIGVIALVGVVCGVHQRYHRRYR